MATKKTTSKNNYAYWNKLFLKLTFLGLGGIVLLFLLANFGVFGTMPTFDELENPDSNVATEIISSDGVTIGRFYRENRTPISYDDLPQHLVDALISTEDERFYSHSGIDSKGTLRAVFKLGTSGGASTISQQLAKNLFHGSEGSRNIVKRVIQKIKEWIIAVKLEKQYTKNEIIAHYFNTVDFVNNAYGIRSAANIYFNKEPRDLTIDESAVLVGMLQAPSRYNPKRNPENAKNRRNVVLMQMERNGFIEPSARELLKEKDIVLDFKPISHSEGLATYFREYLRDYMKTWIKENKKADGSSYNIYSDGLKIHVTIDSRMQQYAEEAVNEHMANLQTIFFDQQKRNKNAPFYKLTAEETDKIILSAMKSSERWRKMKAEGKDEKDILASFDVKTDMTVFSWKGERDTIMTPRDSIRYYKHFLRTGLISMEPQTGHVKAWVGGINYKHFQYDNAGKGTRQVGSTFKPFVYAAAIENLNMSPCDTLIDSQYTIPAGRHGVSENWTPKNSDGKYSGSMKTLKSALANSVNTITAKLIDQTGPTSVIEMAKKLGVTSEIPKQVSIALGAVDISVHDMVAAFSTFANKGIYIKPQMITRIEDKNGNLLFQTMPESRDVLNQDIAYAVVKLMEGVTESGTGSRLRSGRAGFRHYDYILTNPIAGKTGTSQNNSDGWFIGFVPNLCTGVWVGGENRAARFNTTAMGQGATTALPIWGIYMDKCYKDPKLNVSKEEFERPKDLTVRVDCWKSVKDTTDLFYEQNIEDFNF